MNSNDNRKQSNFDLLRSEKKQKRKGGAKLGLKIISVILLFLVLSGGAFAAKIYLSLKKVVKDKTDITAEGLKGDLDLSSLKGEGDGRVNILLLGTGDAGHAGEGLTDTILVASIDPKTNDLVMLGIPRDLYVRVPGYGWDKINSANALAEQQKPGSGLEVIKKTVSDVIDQPIQYAARVDFSGFRLSVDKLGGINVFNPSDLSDPEYPCDKNEDLSCGFKLKSGLYKMDGTLALKYARCRKGTCGDDYGRARRQQSVIVGMRDQALQLGNILNPAKVTDLVSIVGDHLKTDLSIEEMKRLVAIGKKINSNKIVNKVLENEDDALVKNSNVGDASVVIPSAGMGNYKAIQSYVRSLFIDGYIKSEGATVEIKNGNAKPGQVYQLSVVLKSLGYNVIKTSSSQTGGDGKTTINDCTNGSKPYTVRYLENRLKVGSQKADKPEGAADIVITLGANYEPQNNN
jgi:LCP family protein required for cell wall assembly